MTKNKTNKEQNTKVGKSYTVPNMMDEFATEYDTGLKKDKEIPIRSGTAKTQQSGVEKVVDVDKGNSKKTT